jgi:alkylation response protein AidB-like acyl-CoA dehydrogenase
MARQTTAAILGCAVEAKAASDDEPSNKELFEQADILVAKAKYHASNAACQAADRAIQVFGGRGYSELFRPARHWQDVRVCRIYEGTDEILKLKIAASVLGKEYAAFR